MEESGAYASNDVAKRPEAFETAKKLLTAGKNVKKIFDGLEKITNNGSHADP